MSTLLATGFVLLPCIATALQSGYDVVDASPHDPAAAGQAPVTSAQYRSLVKRLERVEEAVGALSVPGVVKPATSGCRLEWDRKSFVVEFEADPESAGRVIKRTRFEDPNKTRYHHYIGVDGSQFSILTSKGGDRADFRTKTEIEAAYQHFSSLMPLAHLKGDTLERLKTMLPDNKNEGRCRKIFALLAANPPEGYDPEIDWVAGWHANVVPKADTQREFAATWNEAHPGSAEDRKQNVPADDRGRAARGCPTERYNSKERRNKSRGKRVSLTPVGRRSDAAVWKPKQLGGSAGNGPERRGWNASPGSGEWSFDSTTAEYSCSSGERKGTRKPSNKVVLQPKPSVVPRGSGQHPTAVTRSTERTLEKNQRRIFGGAGVGASPSIEPAFPRGNSWSRGVSRQSSSDEWRGDFQRQQHAAWDNGWRQDNRNRQYNRSHGEGGAGKESQANGAATEWSSSWTSGKWEQDSTEIYLGP
ncbi:hypothetical protein FOZ63_027990, partial [Perkinsus olseni]